MPRAPASAISQRAQLGMHAQVVGDVVTPVLVRGRHRRRQPDAVDAKPGKVVEPLDDAGQVAVAVAVGVQPRPDIELIEHRTVPPALPAVVLVHLPPIQGRPKPTLAGATACFYGSARPTLDG